MAHRIISEIAKVFTRNSDNLYAPLDAGSKTIRLLRLMPGAWQEDIRAQLLECTITDARDSYIAISYAWGHADVVPQVPIECNSRAVYISENLFTAFRALRRHDHWILLWADALCINQADTLERTIQVGLMGEIYSGSTETVIWLGELPTHDKLSSGPMNSGALSRHFSQSQTTWTGDSRDDSLLNAYLADLALSPMAGSNDAATANTGPDIFGAFCLIQDFAGNIFHPVLEALNHERTFALRSHGISSSWHGLVLAKNYVRGSKSSRVWEGLAKLMSRPWVRLNFPYT
ncbi:heterokaryon incompatibility protein-like protein [Stemphylium lycopersici]|uniref:Heterokaryon incompatibility protein-like protein n=1 Tax=Stemphylium lycopersici TaxID=183478 RepID=A0A364NG72_STELY|nr:heterokaryon incompatibility protein-like protein [Stemphylium lycopersici]RAR16298.1 heterokaryon incompatibility protein-like protein [Stemphylium lycopersici]